ncbi:RluA family pseudouridine synthase [Gammaproteobacteria bacterium]|nr:RluA family pseudouridine synthase [Gammaproteobacteria bacterium]
MSVKILEVNIDNNGRRLDNYLISIYKNIPKSKIYNIIRKGEVRINSGRVRPYYKIKTGDKIRIPPYLEQIEKKVTSIDYKLHSLFTNNIIFENGNFLVINKPYGISVHSGSKNNYGIIDIARDIYGNALDLCHRIDKETSGCLVLSKNKQSNKWFNEQLVTNKVKKKYVAILKGHLKKNIKLNTKLDKYFDNQSKSYVNTESGKESSSSFKIKKLLNSSCFVEIEIFTGRTHQIRVQSNYIGHPILNDKKYGDKNFNKNIASNDIKRMALHASEIRFVDQDGIKIDVKSELDEAFLSVLDALE